MKGTFENKFGIMKTTQLKNWQNNDEHKKELLLIAHCFSVEVSHWRHTKSVSRLGLWSVGTS